MNAGGRERDLEASFLRAVARVARAMASAVYSSILRATRSCSRCEERSMPVRLGAQCLVSKPSPMDAGARWRRERIAWERRRGYAPGKGGGEEWLTCRKKQSTEAGAGKPEATRCAKFSPGSVKIGTPLHSTSPDAYTHARVRQRPPTWTLTSAQGAAYILDPAVAKFMCAHSYLYRCAHTHTHTHTHIHAREQ
jgi:hypothetical protein